MTRKFEIYHSPNDRLLPEYVIRQENGKPCLDNPPTIHTGEKMDLVRALIDWIDGEE
jgi:hypothetical protein